MGALAEAHAGELEGVRDEVTDAKDVLLCAVCLTEEKTVCLFSFSHLCLCKTCAALPDWSKEVSVCPMCQGEVTSKKHIFLS